MNLITALVMASALGSQLLPKGNRIVYDNALRDAYLADIRADEGWTACRNAATLAERQAQVRARLMESIGGFPERCPLNVQVKGRVRRDGYAVEKLMFESEPGHHVTAHLFLPDPAKFPGKRPGIVIPCGHSVNGKASKGYQRGALQAALRGMAALVFDPIDQGERHQSRKNWTIYNTKAHNEIGRRAELLGWSALRFRARDAIRALDVLVSRPEIDASRLGVMGHSGGGTMTSWLMALDDRIVCAAPSGFLSTMRSVLEDCGPQDAEQFVYGELAFGFNHLGHILLRAPSPVLHCSSHGDFFPLLGVTETAARAQDVYAMLGRPGAYRLSDTLGLHHWHESTRTLAVDWMAHWLLGEKPPEAMQHYRDLQFGFDYDKVDTAFGYEPKSFADMRTNRWEASVSPTGQVLDMEGERSAYDLMKDEADRQAAARPALTPEAVRKVAQIRPAAEVAYEVRDRHEAEDVSFATLVRPDGTPIPTAAVGAGDPVLLVSDVRDRGKLEKDVDRLVKEGCRVTVADIRGFGENFRSGHDFYGIRDGDEEISLLYHLVGRCFTGARAEDVIAAAKFAGAGKPVKLVAKGRAAIPAAHAYCTARDLFGGFSCENAPCAWAELFADDGIPCRFADVVRGAWRFYDWTDLVK